MIITGDCLVEMATLPSESIDAIVTDPPAGISFMSKNWDHDKGGRTEWVAWMTEVMRECYRLLKPGGYAVVWSLPRTCHWTAWAMEDAGFIIRDQLAHIFASGFPKGKAQLKPAREDWWLARKPGPLRPLNIEETRLPAVGYEKHATPSKSGLGKHGIYSESTREQGANSPTRYDPSGRWPSNLLLSTPELFDEPNPYVVGSGATATSGLMRGGTERKPAVENGKAVYGKFGGNATDEDTIADSGGYSRFFIIPKADRSDREPIVRPEGHEAGKRFSTHPTMKPTDLMRHLVRLVTPSGGTVLDCFAGSGSTILAAEMEGFQWIAIEQSEEYVRIMEARLNGTQRGLGLDVPAPTRKRTTPSDEKLAELGKTYPRRGWMPDFKEPDEEPAA